MSINLIVTSFMRAQGRLMSPTMLGLRASLGLLAGFAVLFAMVHLRKLQTTLPGEPDLLIESVEPCSPTL